MKEFDTITAISTGLTESGVSIIRISGENALSIISRIFIGKNNRKIDDINSYSLRYGKIVTMNNREMLDEVLVSYMKAPKSYTMEDVVEINCHGGIISTKRILEEVVKCGARIADNGEFTKRAFLNGRIDLSQAEAVMDIINAKTELSVKSALMQSQGAISKNVNFIRNDLLKILAHIEATVDYPEEDIEEITANNAIIEISHIMGNIESLIKTAEEGKILRDGINIVIIGKPNVGKSSILNSLIKESKAIVTEIPGTTRDIIEEYINIQGIPLKIYDTAGIRETKDIVEKIGVEKTFEKIEDADLIMMVFDSSRPLDAEDYDIIKVIKNKKYITVLNKVDIDNIIKESDINQIDKNNIVEISAKTGKGIEKLKEKILELFFKGQIKPTDLLITNMRHKEALIRAYESCSSAINALNNTSAIDLASIDIKNAWNNLGEITGDTLEEDIIDKIFSQFCIGK